MVRRFKFNGRSRTVAGIAASLYSSFKSKKRAQNKSYPGKSSSSSYKKKNVYSRKSRSRTTTRSKKARTVLPTISGISHSFHTTRSRARVTSNILKLPRGTYRKIATGGSSSGYTSQGVTAFSNMAQTDLNVFEGLTKYNSGITVGGVSAICNNYYISYCKTTTTITNQSLDSCKVYIYDLIGKVSVLNGGTYYKADDAWADGVTEQQGANSNTELFPGSTPTHYKLFNHNFWISRVTPVELAAGTSHEHCWYRKINKVYSNDQIANFSYWRGLHQSTMIVHYGLPHDNTTLESVVGTVSLTPVKIVYATSFEISGAQVSNTFNQEGQINGLTNNPTHLYGLSKSQETEDFTVSASAAAAVTKNIIGGLGV